MEWVTESRSGEAGPWAVARKRVPALVLSLALAGWIATPGGSLAAPADRTCLEPLPHRNQFPTSAIFLEPEPLSPCTAPMGRRQWRGSVQWSNTTAVREASSTRLVVDHERLDGQLTVRHGLSETSDFGLRAGAVRDGPGIADAMISRHHRRFGFPEEDRKKRGRGEFDILYSNGGTGDDARMEAVQQAFSEPVISYRRQLGFLGLPWLEPLLVGWRAEIKLPVSAGAPPINSGRADGAIGLMADTGLETPIGRIGLNLHGSLVLLGEARPTVFDQRRAYLAGGGAVGLNFLGHVEAIVQWLGATQRYDHVGISYLDRSQNILSTGLRLRVGDHRWSFIVTEDMTPASEDIGVVVAWQFLP